MFLARNTEVCAAELDGEICLFDPVKAEYLNLNSTGSAIWNLLEQPTKLEQLFTALQTRYNVDTEICRQETETFIYEALKSGIIKEYSPM